MFKSGTVSVVVDDFKRAVQFYVETLGMKMQHQVEGHLAVVELPGLTISLLCPREQQESPQGKSGRMSLGLEVENLESAVEKLASKGVQIHHSMEEQATRLAFFNDPDGNSLYLIELKQ